MRAMKHASTLASLVVVVTLAGTLPAQSADPSWSPEVLDQLRRLQKEALSDDYAYDQLAHLTDHIGPRASGSLQAAAAVDHVAAEMRRLGLDVRLEKVKVPRWVRGEDRAELVAYAGQVAGTTQRIAVTALGAAGISTGPEGITGDIVVVNSFADLAALAREQVAGRIVVFNRIFDRRMADAGLAFDAYGQAVAYRNDGRAAASKLGAAAVLVRSVGGA